MRVGSLFSGIGGLELGLERAGMTTVFQAEYEKQARSVLRKHWPNVTRYEDVHDVNIKDTDGRHGEARESAIGHRQRRPDSSGPREPNESRTIAAEAVDVICGGFPCQDYSVAGKRGGLVGDRGALWWEMHRIVAECRPTWVIGENVPGLLSSNGGRDFLAIVGSLVQLGYGVTWATLDSQYFGVAQRRRRLFIVGHSGGVPRPEILAISEGLRGHPAPSREAGQGITPGTSDGIAQTLTANDFKGPGHNRDQNIALAAPIAFTSESVHQDGTHHPLRVKGQAAIAFDTTQVTSKLNRSNPKAGDPCHPLAAGAHAPLVIGLHENLSACVTVKPIAKALRAGASAIQQVQWASGGGKVLNDSAQTLRSGAEHNYQFLNTAIPRRLTPTECERLQGFPDDWTELYDDGTRVADGPRYRMLGNAVTVNVAEWIGKRIMEAT
jgi:DNA (cytosine-5)-methyltransferase 1